MLPLFTNERRKPINLGGPSSASTHAAILDQAKARRSERQDLRKRIDAAVRIQAWWRGVQTRRQLRCRGESGDVGSLDVLRWVVLVGEDDDVLGRWSMGVVGGGDGGAQEVLRCAEGVGANSWVVLIRQMSVLLLKSVAHDPLCVMRRLSRLTFIDDFSPPRSQYATAHLKILSLLMEASPHLGADTGLRLGAEIIRYLLSRSYYPLLAQSISKIVRRHHPPP
jgi:ubiquitin-protein ligase E3 C